MKGESPRSKRWVIKLGTSILTDESGDFSVPVLERIVNQLVALLEKGYEVILVSSGAIALGMETMNFEKRPKALPGLQACAAIGQGKLMKAYETAFSTRGYHSAQILLTRDGLENRERYVNAKNTINALLKMGAVPIVNENDTVATEEIKFGDNDTLGAQVANMVEADLLIFLSDIEGFYTKDKMLVRHIYSLEELKEYMSHIYVKKNEKTAGGMKTKLNAAKVAMTSGIPIVLTNGRDEEVFEKIVKGEEVGSLFHPTVSKTSARKKWLAHSASVKGKVFVDDGAYQALVKSKKSLLPGGVVSCSGGFEVGDRVELVNQKGEVFATGLINYSREEVNKIKGRKTSQVVDSLGYKRTDELIHRDNLAVLSI
ncbi:MAG: glutamate 5-kinase [Omnitrophica bacterium RIFCSPLOWO2_12_FULL_44_17]|uniref:Glutamate 5-kinase n=1 Tax=Candidatus Danuiimicrobium aquiferis TaxID=1801832 RepID=A0A1G1KS32_9BACT|nr:MAG: glutamate 5-kinase [Omnitrophica bacterium RIFCSPHIGHO2_02_FULL_45_28]OGW91221.1 MAG: glutamate 5-kinase [Omnitrophica bacterium RIFCSPHIGHO2_12_FULL_44_12]OGW95622.1 MAG: glutamate 5-kinase [Omnitrophica bacterium RIFCSPLOWO2_12_FULL_44_17]OGX03665.1 MAG: glutamate 5-kinase [Omnitrophica bacterium RIFCSPLOWO2_02_FULL_44_11]